MADQPGPAVRGGGSRDVRIGDDGYDSHLAAPRVAVEVRRDQRRLLLEHVAEIQLEMLANPSAVETRAALREARSALRQHDAETVARFEVAIRKEVAR